MRPYLTVLVVLLALTVITVSVSYVQFGSPMVNVVVTLGIASLKGSLVALYFMHLRHDKPISAIIFVTGLVFLALFLMFCYLDQDTRDQTPPPTWKKIAQPEPPHFSGRVPARALML